MRPTGIMTIALLLAAAVSYASSLALPVPGGPGRLLAADINGDGRQDLVVGGRHSILVILNRGGGRMEVVSMLPVDGKPTEMIATDLNGDGFLDVVYADHDSFSNFVLLGDGKGAFRKAGFTRARPSGRPHTHGLLTGDWNGDGKADVLHFTVEESRAVPLLGDGKGELAAQPSISIPTPENPVLADLNKDGKPDLVVPDIHHGGITVSLGGPGGFPEGLRKRYSIPSRPYYASAGDINGDGNTDIFTTHDDTGLLSVLHGDGKGAFQLMPGSPVNLGMMAYGLTAGDFNGDGKTDIVASSDQQLVLLLQTKQGTLAPPVRLPKPPGAWEIITADWNGDGAADIAYSNREAGTVHILWGPLLTSTSK